MWVRACELMNQCWDCKKYANYRIFRDKLEIEKSFMEQNWITVWSRNSFQRISSFLRGYRLWREIGRQKVQRVIKKFCFFFFCYLVSRFPKNPEKMPKMIVVQRVLSDIFFFLFFLGWRLWLFFQRTNLIYTTKISEIYICFH